MARSEKLIELGNSLFSPKQLSGWPEFIIFMGVEPLDEIF